MCSARRAEQGQQSGRPGAHATVSRIDVGATGVDCGSRVGRGDGAPDGGELSVSHAHAVGEAEGSRRERETRGEKNEGKNC